MKNKLPLSHVRVLNAGQAGPEDAPVNRLRIPLAACDCDEHCNVDICGVDDVEVDACGAYGG